MQRYVVINATGTLAWPLANEAIAQKVAAQLNRADGGESYVVEEGEKGVCLGFSSADRDGVASPLPWEPGEFVGNDDPTFFFTAEVEAGQPVEATASVSSTGETHPLYQQLIDRDENDE